MNGVLYDLTHLSHRAEVRAPSGIDRVDLMFARAFAASPALAGAVHYGVRRPSLLKPVELQRVVERADRLWQAPSVVDPAFARLRARLLGRPAPPLIPASKASWRREFLRRSRIGRFKLISSSAAPRDAVYLNIAQHALERRSHFGWLDARPDVKPVFFLHDLLPIDYPEFWPAGHEAHFAAKFDTMFALARGLVTSSTTVAARAREEYARRGKTAPPIFSRPLPSPLEATAAAAEELIDAELAAVPYVVTVGSIEPRKNHLLLLNLWREMSQAGVPAPRLVLVGGRGWLNAETLAVLERARGFEGLVIESAGLADASMRVLLRNARALLAPSFAEGYGLPLVEALEQGTPVIASDLPIFREVAQGCATYLAPTDGPGWRRAVLELRSPIERNANAAGTAERRYERSYAQAYFDGLAEFLESL